MTHIRRDFLTASSALAETGWCVIPDLLGDAATAALTDECLRLHDSGGLQAGRIGSGRLSSTLRGDHTAWFITEAPSAPQRVFNQRMDQLRRMLNRELMLGLVDSEAHYAAYPAGAGYARHLDQPHGNDSRVVSAVLYLNTAWQASQGGALRLHLVPGQHHDVSPQGGSLALFMSGQVEHEVLPALRPRLSIACWLRQRTRTA